MKSVLNGKGSRRPRFLPSAWLLGLGLVAVAASMIASREALGVEFPTPGLQPHELDALRRWKAHGLLTESFGRLPSAQRLSLLGFGDTYVPYDVERNFSFGGTSFADYLDLAVNDLTLNEIIYKSPLSPGGTPEMLRLFRGDPYRWEVLPFKLDPKYPRNRPANRYRTTSSLLGTSPDFNVAHKFTGSSGRVLSLYISGTARGVDIVHGTEPMRHNLAKVHHYYTVAATERPLYGLLIPEEINAAGGYPGQIEVVLPSGSTWAAEIANIDALSQRDVNRMSGGGQALRYMLSDQPGLRAHSLYYVQNDPLLARALIDRAGSTYPAARLAWIEVLEEAARGGLK